MHRRDLIRSLAAATALPFVPGGADAAVEFGRSIHERLAQGQGFRTLGTAQQALVTALCDGILPRTDTPSASDVGVPQFIDLLLTEWYDAEDRDRIVLGLAAIDMLARQHGAAAFADLGPVAQTDVLEVLDGRRGDASDAGRTFGTLKSLTVYGYFTSEPISKDVLKTEIFFADFDGCAPVGG
jgi:hypothetical protein